MGDRSAIEWTDSTWNPIRARNKLNGKVGWHCTHASPGCINCYSEKRNLQAWTIGTGLPYKPGHEKDIEVFLDHTVLTQPLRWKKPRMIFVCSMTDLFGDFVKDEWIDKMFAVMALTPHHTYQVLTKRSERMRRYFRDSRAGNGVYAMIADATREFVPNKEAIEALMQKNGAPPPVIDMPVGPPSRTGDKPEFGYLRFINPQCHDIRHLSNVWLGISAEDQQRFDERIRNLLDTPAAIRFVSFEPLIGPINAIDGLRRDPGATAEFITGTSIDWAIVGGESGKNSRPMHRKWADDLVLQCRQAGVATFVKQLGAAYVDPLSNTYGRYFMLESARSSPHLRVNIEHGERLGVIRLTHKKGGDIAEFPDSLKVREMPLGWIKRIGRNETSGTFLDLFLDCHDVFLDKP